MGLSFPPQYRWLLERTLLPKLNSFASEFGYETIARLSGIRMEGADQFVVFTGRQMSRSTQVFLEWLRDEAVG